MHYATSSPFVPPRPSWGRVFAAACGLLAVAIGLPGCGGTVAGTGSGTAATPSAAVDRPSLCDRIDAVIVHARDRRLLDAGVQGAWQVVHGILAFGPTFPVAVKGRTVPALDHLLGGGPITGWKLRRGDPGVIAVVEEGSTMGQGHPDQWLGYLSQCGIATDDGGLAGGIPLDTPLVVGGRQFTLLDLLAQAQHDIRPGQEATWTLMALAAWLPHDAAWTSGSGETWTTERVVRMEAGADIISAACGGTHRLYGLAAAINAHGRATNGEPSGAWAEAAAVLDDCIDRARRFQQPDGSFSIHYFDRPGTSPDVFAKLAATGHVFEVLAVALDDERLAEPWVTRAADRLVTLLEQTEDVDVECGGLYHAVHGLALYRRRICPDDRTSGDPAVMQARRFHSSLVGP
ncbi:MAG: ADP-ribosylation factor-directed GTPase activating protein isoform b [Pirellulales bacterium]